MASFDYVCRHRSNNLTAVLIAIPRRFQFHELAIPSCIWSYTSNDVLSNERLHRICCYRYVVFVRPLLEALQKLQLPYEESLSLIRLTSIEADLQVSVQAWMGTGLIKVKQRTHRSVLREIVSAMNEYFRMSSVPTNIMPCVFFLVIGGLMVIFTVSMLLRPKHLLIN